MLVLLLAIVAIGLKTVGLILIIALVIIPPAAARFWTDRLGRMVALSAAFGGLAGWIGGGVSAVFPAMPAGAVIVLAAAAIFTFSLLFAPSRGVVPWSFRRVRMRLAAAETRALLTIAGGYQQPDPLARRIARWRGSPDRTTATAAGRQPRRRSPSAKAVQAYRQQHPDAALSFNPLGGFRIEDVLSADIVAALESDSGMNARIFCPLTCRRCWLQSGGNQLRTAGEFPAYASGADRTRFPTSPCLASWRAFCLRYHRHATLMLGAMVAAIIAAGLIETIRRVGRLEASAAMGVVFTAMFAVGIVCWNRPAPRMPISTPSMLYGNLESTLWLVLLRGATC